MTSLTPGSSGSSRAAREVDAPRVEVAAAVPVGVEVVGRPIFEDLEPAGVAEAPPGWWLVRQEFVAKAGQVRRKATESEQEESWLGLGKREELSRGSIRLAAAGFARRLGGSREAALDLGGLSGLEGSALSTQQVVTAAVEGFCGASYRFDRYRSSATDAPSALTLVVPGAELDAAREALDTALVIAGAVRLARDLANEPAGELTPVRLAAVALEVAARSGLQATVFEQDRIVDERLGGLLGVAAGSDEPPRLIKLVYEPSPERARVGADGSVPTVALVGKGITFDSGGLSLKTADGMTTMKTDMSGAAAVIAALGACEALGVGVRVIGFAPATENMPGGRAIKPGDVLQIRNGKTIEVLNTDAEGRLVLADALSLAVEEAPDAIVDLATLTGACVVALGRKVAGLMGNDDRLIDAVHAASERAGEPTWPLPLPEVYRSDIDSEIADMKNTGKPGSAGALSAGLLLREFVGDRPWVHLDIAGPSRSDEDAGEWRKGATGFGVRTVLELLVSYEPLGSPAVGARG